jgi:hypothetical protein
MKMRSDLLFSVTLAVAATSGALAQASHRQLRFGSVARRHRSPLAGSSGNCDCMGYWEPATPMSKSEWRQACRRTLNGTDLVPPRSGAKGN